MHETITYIIFKLSDGKINTNSFPQIVNKLLAIPDLTIPVDTLLAESLTYSLKQDVPKGSNKRFLIIRNNFLKKLMNITKPKIGQIESSIIITIKLISKIEYDFVSL